MKNTRTTNSLYNFVSGISGEAISILMQFVCRTVFIYTLGKSFLGISSLFANILSMLTLAEFGVGNAILYKLYEPIEKDDRKRIRQVVRFSKKTYKLIGITVAVLGTALIPFLPFFVKEYGTLSELHINGVFIFFLYLFQSVSSYFFLAYKSIILQANQKAYVINLTNCIGSIASRVVQMILLFALTWAGVAPHIVFIVYVVIQLLTVIIQNFINAVFTDRLYPWINEDPGEKITKEEVRDTIKDCSALFIYKLNHIVLKSTDNIIISKFLGLASVALYSNYYVLYTTLNSIFIKVYDSVVHSLGNLHTKGELRSEYKTFKAVSLITSIIGATAGVGIFVVSDEFICSWIGSDWLIPAPFSLLMGIELYALAIRIALDKYRTAMGLFRQVKYRPLISMAVNLAVSIVFVGFWGISGVIVGTIVSDYTTMLWFDPIIIHKHGFRGAFPAINYFGKRIIYTVIFAASGALCKLICTWVLSGYGWLSVIVHAVICAVIVPTVFILVTKKTEENEYVLLLAKNEMSKMTSKLKKIRNK